MGQLCFRSERNNNRSPEDHKSIKKNESVVRFFMAGMGSAGKSTIIRQLHHLSHVNPNYKVCNDDWTQKQELSLDRDEWQNTIRRNLLDAFDIFIQHIKENNKSFESTDNAEFAETIHQICDQMDPRETIEFNQGFEQKLCQLFGDKVIQDTIQNKNQINISHKKIFDGVDYFLNDQKITEIFNDDYNPSDSDKIHSRKPTVDMNKYKFIIYNMKVEITDVGGQQSELLRITDYLQNWSFAGNDKDRNFILLVVAMSDYNIRHAVHRDYTLFDEAIEFTKILLNNEIAQTSNMLIFFNKKDRFKEKLNDELCRKDLSYLEEFLEEKVFDTYLETGKYDEKIVFNAITAKFISAIKDGKQNRTCYCRHTCAVDSQLMEGIFGTIQNEILNASNVIYS